MALLVCLANAACPAAPSDAAEPGAKALPDHSLSTVEVLPLQRGFYVASDTPCAQASNATLLLLRRNGIGGARDFCEFKRIQQSGSALYLVDESCADFQGGESQNRQLEYTIESNIRLIAKGADGVVLDARYCAQSELPPDWRETDISTEID